MIAGSVVGVLIGFRALGLWESGPHQRVPTGGLVYLGSILIVVGLAQLNSRLWRGGRNANIKVWESIFGRAADNDSPTSHIRSEVQQRLVAREERERDMPSYRYRAGTAAIAAGMTIVCSALLR